MKTFTFFVALQLIFIFMKLNGMMFCEWVFVFMPWMIFVTILGLGNSVNIASLQNYTDAMQRQLFSIKKWYVNKEK